MMRLRQMTNPTRETPMPLLKLDGPIAFSGKIKGYTKSSLAQRIRDAGGSVVTTPNASCALFLMGERAAYKKVDKAKALGLTIVEGDVLYELLEKGEVDWDDSVPTRPLDELIADARAIFDGAPSREAWASICALADECDGDHIHDLIAYLTPQLDAWPDPSFVRHGYDSQVGTFTHAAGSLRMLPGEWITAMINGEEHPKHALATALSFTSAAVNNTLSTTIFDNPDLGHLTTFDVGANLDQNVKKKTFYKAMASCPHLGNVDTLMLSRASKGSFAELAKATSLPNLRRIVVRPGTERMGADLEAALFGPWAPRLEAIAVSTPDHLRLITSRLDELTSLETLSLGTTSWTDDAYFDAYVEAMGGGALEPIRVLELGVISYVDADANVGFGRMLDAIDTDLDTLDLRACDRVELSGPIGAAFMLKHLVENGLSARVGVVLVGENISPDVCAALADAGVDLVSPHDDGATDPVAPTFDYVSDPAPGEAERVAANQVHVHDAMMFTRPSSSAWGTLTGVVDGLELQLDADAFAAAVDTLEAYLEPWEDHMRVLPDRWLGELFADAPSPKLRLARAVRAQGSYHDPKGHARFWQAAAEAGNMKHFKLLTVSYAGKQKYWIKTLAALFEAVEPTQYTIAWMSGKSGMQALEAELEGTGLLPSAPAEIPWTSPTSSTDPATLDLREVTLTVTSPDQLQQVFDRTDLDHVVSLDLKFDLPWPDEPAAGWAYVTATPASWARLRHLSVNTGTRLPSAAYAPLVTWLSQARPVQFDDAFSSSAPYDTPVLGFLEAGVYSRTYGSEVDLPSSLSQDQAEELFGGGRVHVARVKIMYGSYSVPDTLDLVDAMHPTMRQSMKQLKWPTTPDELTRVDALLEGLPNLAIWSPICPDLRTEAGRASLFAALAASPASARLAQVRTIAAYAEQPKARAAELKVMDRGAGMKSSGWIIHQL
jgi:hypothetical protein